MLSGASSLIDLVHEQLYIVSAGSDEVWSTNAFCCSLGVESVAEVVPMGFILFIMLIL